MIKRKKAIYMDETVLFLPRPKLFKVNSCKVVKPFFIHERITF